MDFLDTLQPQTFLNIEETILNALGERNDITDEIEYIEKYTSDTLAYVQIKMNYTLTLAHDYTSVPILYVTRGNNMQYLKLDGDKAVIPFTVLRKMYRKVKVVKNVIEHVFGIKIQILV